MVDVVPDAPAGVLEVDEVSSATLFEGIVSTLSEGLPSRRGERSSLPTASL
jgi:hypothetical protein